MSNTELIEIDEDNDEFNHLITKIMDRLYNIRKHYIPLTNNDSKAQITIKQVSTYLDYCWNCENLEHLQILENTIDNFEESIKISEDLFTFQPINYLQPITRITIPKKKIKTSLLNYKGIDMSMEWRVSKSVKPVQKRI